MSSKAVGKFETNKADVERLLEIHGDLTGAGPGRRRGVGVLNKSAIIMICACWEAFVEDLAEEAVQHLAKHLKDPMNLSKDVISSIVDAHSARKDDMKVWKLVVQGWKAATKKNARYLTRHQRGWGLNTPNSENVRSLMKKCIGVEAVESKWYWPGMSREQATAKLDKLVARRGDLAHGKASLQSVTKTECSDFLNFIERLAKKTEASVGDHLFDITGSNFL